MRSDPLVSVVIPNYNYAGALTLCLDALARQTYRHLEVVVVDDGSTDDSVSVAERAGATVLRSGRNTGCAAARNRGVERATGEVLFFLDSDVALEPGAVAGAVAGLRADPAIGALCGVYSPEPLIVDSRIEEYRALQLHYWQATATGEVSNLYPAMAAMRRTVFDEVGPFNPDLRQTEDADYGHRVSQRYKVVLDPAVSGRHDHDSTLPLLLWKLFTRTRLRIPLYARRRRFSRGFETATRGWGCLAALFSLVSLPFVVLFGWWWLVVPVLLAVVSALTDLGMYRFAARHRGAGFAAFCVGMQYLANATIATGLFAGAVQWVLSGRFRRLYDEIDRVPGAVPA